MYDPQILASIDALLADAEQRLAALRPRAALSREGMRLGRTCTYLNWARAELSLIHEPLPAERVIEGFAVERPRAAQAVRP